MIDPLKLNDILYAKVILPLAVPKQYLYAIPVDLIDKVQFGIRVEVPLRSKLYSAIVVETTEIPPSYTTRQIISVLDDTPIINTQQYQLWQWIAEYYCATIGEVMNVAIPAGLKLSSETKLLLHPEFELNWKKSAELMSHQMELVLASLQYREELSIQEVQDILQKKTVYPLIKTMLDFQLIVIKEELKQKYKEKTIDVVRLAPALEQNPDAQSKVLEMCTRSEKQLKAALAFFAMSNNEEHILRSELQAKAEVNSTVIRSMVKKGVFIIDSYTISRLHQLREGDSEPIHLTEIQSKTLNEIDTTFLSKKVCLLKGVTGSGKTQIYLEMIQRVISNGGQVLFMLPEIGLTTQMVSRVRTVFGNKVGFYHSRMNSNERVDLWKDVASGEKTVIIGARSSVFLPFANLGLIVVDEEHDPSYKQQDPAPRYNGRDSAIILGNFHDCMVLLGSATPSLESMRNGMNGKYGLVQLNERYGNAVMPQLEIIDLRKARKQNRIKEHFSTFLLDAIQSRLDKKEQVIIFQNRRGYSPSLRCGICGWYAECDNCDVSRTYHQYLNELKCHYCGSRANIPKNCPDCGSHELTKVGFGTEKIEDTLNEFFPPARVARMDYDSVRTKKAFENIIYKMENHQIDILVGTQMVTKGLDFENITLVGILNADSLIHFPEFRATERAFQLMTQVSGRAGRKDKEGLVLIQTSTPHHPVIREVLTSDYDAFYHREIQERKDFVYPPEFALIRIILKHKNPQIVSEGAQILASLLRPKLKNRLIGPAPPSISRVRNMYLHQIMIKSEKSSAISKQIKNLILSKRGELKQSNGFKSLRINIDVDPY